MSGIDSKVIRRIVRNLILTDKDYRVEIVSILNAQFLEFAMDFFEKVSAAKIRNKEIDEDWYRAAFIDGESKKDAVAINAGLNIKTITNICGTGRRDVVMEVAKEHYDGLLEQIDRLTEERNEMNFALTIKMGKVGVELNIRESLIVINALAVRRAAMRGGLWSSAGKRAEGALMKTLCELYSVPQKNWATKQIRADGKPTYEREIDFFLLSGGKRHKCEVKLMGRGNPESADAVIARSSKVFVADTLSDTNKNQLDDLSVLWVALKEKNGYARFAKVLKALNIPHKPPPQGNLEGQLDEILANLRL